MDRPLRKYAVYVVGAYGIAALWTTFSFWAMVAHNPSAKSIGEAAYYSITWPQLWWMIAAKAGWIELLPFLWYGAIHTAPVVLLVAGSIWGVRYFRNRIIHGQ